MVTVVSLLDLLNRGFYPHVLNSLARYNLKLAARALSTMERAREITAVLGR